MKRLIILAMTLAAMAAGYACSHSPGSPEPKAADLTSLQRRVAGEYLVTLVPGADQKVINGIYGYFGIKGIKDLGNNLFLVTLTEDPGPEKMEELSKQNSQVKAVQPNFVYRTNSPP